MDAMKWPMRVAISAVCITFGAPTPSAPARSSRRHSKEKKAQWLPSTKICSCSSITIQNSFKQHGDKWIFWQNEPTLSALKSRVFNPPSGYRKGEVSYFDKCTLSFQHNLPFFLWSVGFSFQTLNLVYLMMYSSIFSVAIFRRAVI